MQWYTYYQKGLNWLAQCCTGKLKKDEITTTSGVLVLIPWRRPPVPCYRGAWARRRLWGRCRSGRRPRWCRVSSSPAAGSGTCQSSHTANSTTSDLQHRATFEHEYRKFFWHFLLGRIIRFTRIFFYLQHWYPAQQHLTCTPCKGWKKVNIPQHK